MKKETVEIKYKQEARNKETKERKKRVGRKC
jgi:hypothetical protein